MLLSTWRQRRLGMQPVHGFVGTSLLASTLLTAACHLQDLIQEPAASAPLALSPTGIADSAAVGDAEPRRYGLSISAPGQPVAWRARLALGAAWVTLSDSVGETPETLIVQVEPAGLVAGSYTDTVIAVPQSGAGAAARVPIRFTMLPCRPACPVSASRSSVSASPSTIMAGTGSSTITVIARDADGNPVSGATVVLSATGTGNTLTQPAAPTNAEGVATGTLSSLVPETKTVSATAGGIVLSQTGIVTVALVGSVQEVTLVESSGTLGESGTVLGKDFNPRNPPLGSTIVATFFWLGSTDVIARVTDYLGTGQPVGNTYARVEYVTRNGFSMATYVATNVRNYPYPKVNLGDELFVQAQLSAPVSDGGAAIAAFAGVDTSLAAALGAHRSASGSDSLGLAHPGQISYGAGTLVYGVSMLSAGLVGMDPPAGFTKIATAQVNSFQEDTEYAVLPSAGTVDPEWTWSVTSPQTWLASVLALAPAAAAAPRIP